MPDALILRWAGRLRKGAGLLLVLGGLLGMAGGGGVLLARGQAERGWAASDEAIQAARRAEAPAPRWIEPGEAAPARPSATPRATPTRSALVAATLAPPPGAGSVLLYKTIKDSFARGDVHYDLGIGYHSYKRGFRTHTETSYRFTHYHAGLRGQGLRVSKATIYNTLNLFAASGLIRQLSVGGDRSWFDSNTDAHYHFHDIETGALMDVSLKDVEFQRLPDVPAGMQVDGIDLVIRLRRREA